MLSSTESISIRQALRALADLFLWRVWDSDLFRCSVWIVFSVFRFSCICFSSTFCLWSYDSCEDVRKATWFWQPFKLCWRQRKVRSMWKVKEPVGWHSRTKWSSISKSDVHLILQRVEASARQLSRPSLTGRLRDYLASLQRKTVLARTNACTNTNNLKPLYVTWIQEINEVIQCYSDCKWKTIEERDTNRVSEKTAKDHGKRNLLASDKSFASNGYRRSSISN